MAEEKSTFDKFKTGVGTFGNALYKAGMAMQGVPLKEEEKKTMSISDTLKLMDFKLKRDLYAQMGLNVDMGGLDGVLGGSPAPDVSAQNAFNRQFRVKSIGPEGPSFERIPEKVGVEGLDATQQTLGYNVAKDVYGSAALRSENARRDMVVPILQRIKAGESPDDIRDSLRYAGQSKEFAGPIRNAAQQIAMRFSKDQRDSAFTGLDDVLAGGDIKQTRDYIRSMALESVGEDRAKTVEGKERTIDFLSEIENDLAAFEKNGGKTNIFNGTLEQIAGKVGLIKNPGLREIATKILSARQQYRRAMTGVAFSPGESAEYNELFPGIDKTANFNSANLRALKQAFSGDVDYFYTRRMGADNYNKIFKSGNEPQGQIDLSGYSDADLERIAGGK